MNKPLMQRARRHTRQSGDALLALMALANAADADGVHPVFGNVQSDVRAARALELLEAHGEIVRVGGGYVVAIAFMPRDLKEIFVRRFRMSPRAASAIVSEAVARQLMN